MADKWQSETTLKCIEQYIRGIHVSGVSIVISIKSKDKLPYMKSPLFQAMSEILKTKVHLIRNTYINGKKYNDV